MRPLEDMMRADEGQHGLTPKPMVADTALRSRPQTRNRLFLKYVGLFVAVVSMALLANGILGAIFYYQEQKATLVSIQREKAEAAADKIEQFVKEIESQLGWTTQLPWSSGSIEQRRFDALRLLRQVPAITELSQIDSSGKERLRVSRLAMDVIDSGIDFSREPKFAEAVAKKVYYGPVYFRRESEPYMTLAIAGVRRDAGVAVAEVNLKLIWDVVSQIKVGEHGRAYVLDEQGRLIAHPDISMVLRNTDMSALNQVRAAREGADPIHEAKDIAGKDVLTASAPVTPLGWHMFVELPIEEAYAPLFAALKRLTLVLFAAMILAVLAGMFLAHRMVGPIRALRAGAARIGGGELSQRITVKTGDELEALADQFNDMAGKLRNSYADLEQKVEARTRDLAQSVKELRALGDVSRAVNSTLDLKVVLETIVAKAVELSGSESGAIYVWNEVKCIYELSATQGMSQDLIATILDRQVDFSDALGRIIDKRQPVQIADLTSEPPSPITEISLVAGFRSRLVVPLIGADRAVGALVVRRLAAGDFPKNTIELLQTFAAQSTLAIENANLFSEIEEKGRQLELASQHKSQFLANMSHELRTPLNAILGYTELILDSIYGEIPDKARKTLERVQTNGKHLLGLINDVLDLSKIEAGQLNLTLSEYSPKDIVHSVFSAVEPLAAEKKLALKIDFAPKLPRANGDERRLTQVLFNLVGNAIKFTDRGEVSIHASSSDGALFVSVHDTGPGISPEDQSKIFEEFQQADSSTTKQKGGTGLGLAIAKRIIELHGGRLWVESEMGRGSTFSFMVPVKVEKQVGHP